MRIAFAFLALGLTGAAPHPESAWAIYSLEGEKKELRAVIVQLDAEHAVIGMSAVVHGLSVKDGATVVTDLPAMPIKSVFEIGGLAPLSRSVVIVCDEGQRTSL